MDKCWSPKVSVIEGFHCSSQSAVQGGARLKQGGANAPPCPSPLNETLQMFKTFTRTQALLSYVAWVQGHIEISLQEEEWCCDQRFVVWWAVEMYGDALMEFLVFPRALCSSQGPVYLGRYRKQLTYNNIVSLCPTFSWNLSVFTVIYTMSCFYTGVIKSSSEHHLVILSLLCSGFLQRNCFTE